MDHASIKFVWQIRIHSGPLGNFQQSGALIPDTDPKWQASYYKDTHRKGPEFVETVISKHIIKTQRSTDPDIMLL